MQIPNPFKLIDHALLDWCFNPIVWSSKKDATELATISSYCGVVCMVIGFLWVGQSMIALVAVVGGVLETKRFRLTPAEHRRNNKTGKNYLRETLWIPRLILLASLIILGCLLQSLDLFKPEDFVAQGLTFSVFGFTWMTAGPMYFWATDLPPPRYTQKITVPSTT